MCRVSDDETQDTSAPRGTPFSREAMPHVSAALYHKFIRCCVEAHAAVRWADFDGSKWVSEPAWVKSKPGVNAITSSRVPREGRRRFMIKLGWTCWHAMALPLKDRLP